MSISLPSTWSGVQKVASSVLRCDCIAPLSTPGDDGADSLDVTELLWSLENEFAIDIRKNSELVKTDLRQMTWLQIAQEIDKELARLIASADPKAVLQKLVAMPDRQRSIEMGRLRQHNPAIHAMVRELLMGMQDATRR